MKHFKIGICAAHIFFCIHAMEHEAIEQLLKRAFWSENEYEPFEVAINRKGFDPNCKILDGARPILADAVTSYINTDDEHKRERLFCMIEELLKRGANPNKYSELFSLSGGLCLYTNHSMVAYIMSHTECQKRYKLILLLLQYGLNAAELRSYEVLRSFNYKKELRKLSEQKTIDDTYKTWMLLCCWDLKKMLTDTSQKLDIFQQCMDMIALEHDALYNIIYKPIDCKESDLSKLCEQARSHLQQVSLREKLIIKKHSNVYNYILRSGLPNDTQKNSASSGCLFLSK